MLQAAGYDQRLSIDFEDGNFLTRHMTGSTNWSPPGTSWYACDKIARFQ